MELGLKNKNVFVTAASKGIGFAIAEMFVEENANVIISSSNEKNLENAVSKLNQKFGCEVKSIKCNLNSKDEVKLTAEKILSDFGNVDILVNNCGGPIPGMFFSLEDSDWQNAFEQVLMSSVRFTRSFLPGMIQNNWGRIINITSLSVKQPVENLMLSNSLRSALVSFSKTLSLEVAKNDITINNIAPGYINTERIQNLSTVRAKANNTSLSEELEILKNIVPAKRIGNPEEIASLAVFLASEKAAYINGATIQVDGGLIKSTY